MAEFKRFIQRTTNSERIENNQAQVEPNEIVIATDSDEVFYKNQEGNFISISKDKYIVGTITELQSSKKYKLGDVVEVLGYYEAGDGAGHKRRIVSTPTMPHVQIANGLYAQLITKEIRPEWLGETNIYNVIENHIKPLSDNENYTILLRKGEYTCIGYGFAPIRKMNTVKNLSIIGSGMPVVNSLKTKLLGGTIIHGPVANSADGFKIKDFGVDLGQEWVDANEYVGWYGMPGDEGVILCEAFDRNNHPRLIEGCYAENINVLMYDLAGRYHAFLIEASTGAYCKNIEIHGGFHGFVIKSENVTAKDIRVYGGGTNAVIIKSDLRSISNITIDNMLVKFFRTPLDSRGLNINPNEFSITDVKLNNVRIEHVRLPIFYVKGTDGATNVTGFDFNELTIVGCPDNIDLSNVDNMLNFDFNDLQITNSGTLILPKAGVKRLTNVYLVDVSRTTNTETMLVATDKTYINGIVARHLGMFDSCIKYSDDYRVGSLVDCSVMEGGVNNNYNKYAPSHLDSVNVYKNFELFSGADLSDTLNTYLEEMVSENNIKINACVKISETGTFRLLVKKLDSIAVITKNVRFQGYSFAQNKSISLVLTNSGIDVEKATLTEGDLVSFNLDTKII